MRLALTTLALAGFLAAGISAQAAPVSAAKGFSKGSEITQVAKKKKMRKMRKVRAKGKKKMM